MEMVRRTRSSPAAVVERLQVELGPRDLFAAVVEALGRRRDLQALTGTGRVVVLDLLVERPEAARLVALQPTVHTLATQAELPGQLGDAETISNDAEHGVVTLLHFD